MKTYRPGQVPSDPANVPGFLRLETAALQRAANAADEFTELQTLHAAPSKVREGMVAIADGTDWNPGYGPGMYVYLRGEWVFQTSSLLALQISATELQRLSYLAQEQLRQLTKIALLLSAIAGFTLSDDEVQAQGPQITQLTKIADLLTVIGGASITDDEIQLPT